MKLGDARSYAAIAKLKADAAVAEFGGAYDLTVIESLARDARAAATSAADAATAEAKPATEKKSAKRASKTDAALTA